MRLSLIPRSRTVAMAVVSALLAGVLASVALTGPAANAAADPDISISAKTDASILDGQNTNVTLTATNTTPASGGTALYNLAYAYVIPTGVSYVAGSAGTAAGEPTQSPGTFTVTNADGTTSTVTGTELVWSNVSDLVAGDAKALAFQVRSTDAAFPVGSSFTGAATVAASQNARTIPTISSTGAVGNDTNVAHGVSNATSVSALKITKAEPSPEHELMRGVHDNATVYTLTVTNTSNAATNAVTVTDDLPAGLEFLQCGGIDHTTASEVEYPGAPRLTATTAPSGFVTADCLTPTSVATTNTVAGQGNAVFTEVTWNVGALAAGASATILYLAAIPLHENTMSFTGVTGQQSASPTAPSATSLDQAANLDNNNGPSTRQDTADTTSNAQGETNLVSASGSYTGVNAQGTTGSTQTASASLTVKAMDLSVVKSVTPTQFAANAFATYKLLIRSSEYESDAGMTITDVIPNGLCPAFDPTNVTFSGDPYPVSCDPRQTQSMDVAVQNATVTGAAYSASTGTFTLTMTIVDIGTEYDSDTSGTSVSYKALMRPNYSSSAQGGPTAAGDAFTNHVGIAGTSTGVHGDTGTQAVVDDSAATITAPTTTISKEVLPPADSTGVTSANDCTTGSRPSQYQSGTPTDSFQLGDLVCFQLTVSFPGGVDSHNADVTDMLPVGTSALDSTWAQGTQWALGAATATSVPSSDVSLQAGSASASEATFAVGHAVSGASGTYVDGGTSGTQLVLYVVGQVTKQGSSATTPDIVDNLMKFSQQNTAGTVSSLRTQAGYRVAANPTATLGKSIVATGTSVGSLAPVSAQPTKIAEGEVLQYQLLVGNTAASGNSGTITNATVWDALPAWLHCADVQAVSNGGTCSNTAPTGAASAYSNDAFLVWTGITVPSAGTTPLTYDVTVPSPGYTGTPYRNAASVTSFEVTNDTGATTTYIPTATSTSVFTATPTGAQGSAPTADASDQVSIPSATVGKTVTTVPAGQTNLPAATNVQTASAVPGEGLSYTYTVTVPAGSSVYNGVLQDVLPTGVGTTANTQWSLTFPGATSAAATVGPTDTTDSQTATFGGSTFTLTGTNDTTHGAGALVFPTGTYDNTTTSDQVFTVTASGLQLTAGRGLNPAAPAAPKNTASFTTTPPSAGGATQSAATAQATVNVVRPSVSMAKTDDANGSVVAGQTVHWTLTATNTSAAQLGDGIIVDCFPNALTYGGATVGTSSTAATPVSLTTEEQNATACGPNTTAHAYSVGTIAPAPTGNTASIVVTGSLAPTAAGASAYTNTGWILGSSLADSADETSNEAVVTSSRTDTVTVQKPSVAKTLTTPTWNATTGASSGTATTSGATPNTVRPGDAGTYTVTVTIPANVNLYDAVVQDKVPTGMTIGSASGITVTPSDGSITPGTPTVSGTTAYIGLGQIQSATSTRTVTITIPVTVTTTDTAATAIANTANLYWNASELDTAPTAPASSFGASVASNAANATVATPQLTIGKTVTTTTPVPGQSFTYTVTVTNKSGATASPAYDDVVTDCVPTGVVVDASTISDGGTELSTPASGCGTSLAWPAQTIVAGQIVTHTYRATLASDATLTGQPLTNTASTGTYDSIEGGGASYPAATHTATVQPSFPSVAVTKSDADGHAAFVGVPSHFSITFKNTGSAASSVVATDVLPHNWTYVAGSAALSPGGSSTVPGDPSVTGTASSGATLTWAGLPALANGAAYTLTYEATPLTAAAASDPGADTASPDTAHGQTNSVTAVVTDATGGTGYNGGAGSFVTYPGGGSSATDTEHIAAADLSVTKTASHTPVAGTTTADVWTITVTNHGPDASNGTTVVDRPTGVPSGAVLQFSGTGWTCSGPTDGAYTCVSSTAVANGASYPDIDVAMTLPADAPLSAIGNTATVAQATGQTYDPSDANDTASASTTPTARADLSIVKTAASAQAKAGQPFSWTLAVTDNGPSDEHDDVRVTDTLPDTTTLTGASGDGWTCTTSGNTLTCDYTGAGDLADGQTATITVTATVKSSVTASQTIDNTATVADATASGSQLSPDPTSSDDQSSTSTGVDDATTLALTKTFDQSAPLVAGSPATWDLGVRNTGDADARTVRISDTLLDGTTLQGSPQTDGDWTCSGSTDVTCVLDGTLAAGATSSFAMVVTTPSGLTGSLTNTATVTAANDPAGATATGDSDASQTSALAIAKTVTTGADYEAGQDVTYQLRVSNPTGPSDLPAGTADQPSIRVQDPLPAGWTLVGASGDGWTVTSGTSSTVVLTSADGLAVGATDPNVITITAHIPSGYQPVVGAGSSGGAVANTANVTPETAAGTQTDSNTVSVDVSTEAVLGITKTLAAPSTGSTDAGTSVTYDVVVRNSGPSDAQNARWTDAAPAGMTVTGVTTDDPDWTQADASDPSTWTAASFPAGASATFVVTATIGSGVSAGTLTNTGTTTWTDLTPTSTDDPHTASASASVTVTTHAALRITKTAVANAGSTTAEDAPTVAAGSQQVFLLQVANVGPSDEQPTTTVTDSLPTGMSFVSATSAGGAWTCSGTTDSPDVTCSLPTVIAAGDSAPAIWITTKVASSFTGADLENVASVTGQVTPQTIGTTGAETSTSTVTVTEDANVAVTIGHTGTAVIGKDVPETIVVANTGPSDARDVTVHYTLPAGLGYVSTGADPAWTVASVVHEADGSTTVTFVLSGTLASGTQAPPITVHQQPTAAAYPGVAPSATVSTSVPETTYGDNTSTDRLAVAALSSLGVTKTHTMTLERGQTEAYTITVHNAGPTADPGPVKVTDALPAGLSFVSVDAGGDASCTTGGDVACTLDRPLAVGASVSLVVTTRIAANAPDEITNTAAVTSPTAQTSAAATTAHPHPMTASDPGAVHAAPAGATLAFTGSTGVLWGLLAAAVALVVGVGLVLIGRGGRPRRRRRLG